ncbi:hypothetical protein B0T10DRAFT_497306 [Thelonectria olida]|uniref:Secreted protein n=1 Tax=Thelonectria olida TaxID=1576542 RepID=A0A9P8VUW0_9HYPO|nr:hypothetical protein B0T10DRAFT_497306 [Thelonectria olida]
MPSIQHNLPSTFLLFLPFITGVRISLRPADSILPYEFVIMKGKVCELTMFKVHLEDILIYQRKAVEGHTEFSGSIHSDSDCCVYSNVLLTWSCEA